MDGLWIEAWEERQGVEGVPGREAMAGAATGRILYTKLSLPSRKLEKLPCYKGRRYGKFSYRTGPSRRTYPRPVSGGTKSSLADLVGTMCFPDRKQRSGIRGRAPRVENPSVQNGEPGCFRACISPRDQIQLPTPSRRI